MDENRTQDMEQSGDAAWEDRQERLGESEIKQSEEPGRDSKTEQYDTEQQRLIQEEQQLSQEEQQFEAELAELMKTDPADKKGRKKKKKREKGQRKPWSRKKKILAAAAAAAVALVAFKACGGKKDQAVMVSTMPLTRGTIQQELTISGPVSGTDSVDVVSSLHAEVTDIQVKEGDHVEQGQLLALIDESDVRKEFLQYLPLQ